MAKDICERSWEGCVEPFRIAGGLYYVGNKDTSSSVYIPARAKRCRSAPG